MAKRPSYPLDAVERVRGVRLEDARRRLGDAEAALADSEARLAAANAALAAHDAETRALENRRDAHTEAEHAIADRLRADAHLRARREARTPLAERAALASRDVETARAHRDASRAEASDAHGEMRTVERHHERWTATERRDAELREETERDDRAPSKRPSGE
ncbi:MAG: hypothetical protein R3A78_00100 [Polyangiales bacterium]